MRTRTVSLLLAGLVAGGSIVAVTTALGPASPVAAHGLEPWGSCEELLAHHRRVLEERGASARYRLDALTAAERDAVAEDAAGSSDAPSGTNLQERGVDEPDVAKLSGGRLLVVRGHRLVVTTGGPHPRTVGSVRLPGDARPVELLVHGDRALVLAGAAWRRLPVPAAVTEVARSAGGRSFGAHVPTTTVHLVDLSGGAPRLLESRTVDGEYLSARADGPTVRLVTVAQPPALPTVVRPDGTPAGEPLTERASRAALAALGPADVLPHHRRVDAAGRVLSEGPSLRCEDVSHPAGPRDGATVVVETFRTDRDLQPVGSVGVTAEATDVYATADRLYVATSAWREDADRRPPAPDAVVHGTTVTEVHAFDTSAPDEVRHVASGEVPGRVIGRWALSRHDGVLRVATTVDDTTRGRASESMVARLVERDGRLAEDGRVEGLGRTEEIKAVRYLGRLASVVTFRQTDPLYLVDLGPRPHVLGELKVPGFSAYLHPVGDGLLVGLGFDADPTNGLVTGLQMSTFDVSDPSAPTLVDRVRLGGRSAVTPATDDARAFTFDTTARTALLPVTGRWGGGRARLHAVTVGEDGRLAVRSAPLASGRQPYPGGPPVRVLLDGEHAHVVSDRVETYAVPALVPQGSLPLG